MEKKRLIPYSVHLREDIYLKLKAAAGARKASSMVRDAITMLIEGDDAYTSGYNKGLRDAMDIVSSDSTAAGVSVNGHNVALTLTKNITSLLITQTKGKANGTKKS
jgi:phage-related protein